MSARLSVVVIVLFAAGCSDTSGRPAPNLERMMDQRAFRTWQGTDLFPDGRVMRTPPRGTLARDTLASDDPIVSGRSGDEPLTAIPLPLDAAIVARGRADFEVYCAVCHGMAGDGVARVAARMELRRPPSLVTEPARSFPPGRVYRAITDGYGLMRPYAEDLPTPARRWGVVAYVEALALSRAAPLDALPPSVRARAEGALR